MMEKMDSHNGQLQQANFSDANTVSPPPAKCCRASPAADDNGAHVCQQFTVVAPWLGLRPHSRGGCIIVTGFRGCAVKQFHAVNRKCNRLRVSILFSRQFTRRQPKDIFRSKFLPQPVVSLSLFSLLLLLPFDHMILIGSYGPTWIFGLDYPGKSLAAVLVILGYFHLAVDLNHCIGHIGSSGVRLE